MVRGGGICELRLWENDPYYYVHTFLRCMANWSIPVLSTVERLCTLMIRTLLDLASSRCSHWRIEGRELSLRSHSCITGRLHRKTLQQLRDIVFLLPLSIPIVTTDYECWECPTRGHIPIIWGWCEEYLKCQVPSFWPNPLPGTTHTPFFSRNWRQ